MRVFLTALILLLASACWGQEQYAEWSALPVSDVDYASQGFLKEVAASDSARLDSTIRSIVRDEMRFLRSYEVVDTVRWDTVAYEPTYSDADSFLGWKPCLWPVRQIRLVFRIDTTGRK